MRYTSATFEKIIQEIKVEFEKMNHGAQSYELAIIIPAINMFANGAHGALFAPNIVSAVSSMRIMLEALGALAYFEKNDPDNDFFNSFLRNERLCKTGNPKSTISIGEQLRSIDGISRYKKADTLYRDMCKMIHFSTTQMEGALYNPELRNRKMLIRWRIGPNLLSRKKRATIRVMVNDMQKIMVEVIRYSITNNNKDTNRFNYKAVDAA